MTRRLRTLFLLVFPALAAIRVAASAANTDDGPAPKETPPGRTDRYGDPMPPEAVTRIGTTRFRHADRIRSVAFSPDGKLLASCGDDRTIRLWDSATGREIHRFAVQDYCSAVAISPDGKFLAAGLQAHNEDMPAILCWDIAERKELWRMSRRASAGNSGGLVFSPNGKILASGNGHGTIFLREAATGKLLSHFWAAHGTVQSLAFSPKGDMLASGSANKIVLWDPASGKELRLLGKENEGGYWYIAFSPDGATLASGTVGNAKVMPSVRLWEVASGKEVREFPGSQAVVFFPDGKMLATGGKAQGDPLWEVSVWDLTSGKQLRQYFGDSSRGGFPMGMAVHGRFLAATADRVVHLWDVSTGKEMLAFQGHAHGIIRVALSADGRTLTSASDDGTVRHWEVATGNELRRIQGLYGGLSIDGKTAALRSDDRTTLDLWDVATGKCLARFAEEKYWFHYTCLSPDGKILAVRNLNETDSWQIATGKKFRQIKESGQPVALSPDNKILAVASHDRISLWDAETGKERVLFGDRYSRAIRVYSPRAAFSKNSKLLVTADYNNYICFWNAATGQQHHQWHSKGDQGTIRAIALSPDGRSVASGHADGTIHLWEAATGKEWGRLAGHLGAVQALAFSADGNLLISGGHDTTILLWDVRKLKREKESP